MSRAAAQYRALAGFIVASAVFVAVFVALTLSAFHKPTPHDLPVGIVGSAVATSRAEHALDSAAPGDFRFRSYPGGGQQPGSRSVRSMAPWSLPARTCGCLSPRPRAPVLSRPSTVPSQPWRHGPAVLS